MRFISFVIILSTLIITVKVSVLTNIQDNVLSFVKRFGNNEHFLDPYNAKIYYEQNNHKKGENIITKYTMPLQRKTYMKDKYRYNNDNKFWLPKVNGPQNSKEHYRIDPVLNSLRRKAGSDSRTDDNEPSDSSSSIEMKDWKNEWKEHWIEKKFEAINATRPTGDQVNMVAARPWGVPCGDPNQHDMPWGTCMLPMECDSEYRIYRGDYFCGRTQFVCCALQINTYDTYQGFDVSFADSNLSTDTEERKNQGKGSKNRKKRKRKIEKRKRKRDRQRRKKDIKKNIRKIINEIRKILSRTYRNGTSERKKKTKQLKKFIKELKKQYRNDRDSVKDIHMLEMFKIDADLMKRLHQIKEVNQNFIKNSTFRDIVTNGKVNQKGLRMLLEAYPELGSYFKTRRQEYPNRPKDYLDYDIEYGLVYN